MDSSSERPDLSLLVPMFNESVGISVFFDAIEPILAKLGLSYEIVCIDDGSSDDTVAQLVARHRADPRIKLIELSRNFGKDTALSAGLDFATGRAVIPLDADLQDPPALIPEMVAKWREGYQVVNAKRLSRQGDAASKRVVAGWFYRVFNIIADRPIPENIGDFRLLDAQVVEALRRMPERARFLKGMFSWVGYKTTEIGYERPARAAGETKWSFWRLWKFALDGITAFSTFPLRIWTYFGLIFASGAFLYALFLIIYTLASGGDVPGYASLMVAVLFLGGVQLIGLGVIGEYLGRIYEESKRRPLYLVRTLHGLTPGERGRAGSPASWSHADE
jgi:glycosyltransferase involved in cell wall biosynthesis